MKNIPYSYTFKTANDNKKYLRTPVRWVAYNGTYTNIENHTNENGYTDETGENYTILPLQSTSEDNKFLLQKTNHEITTFTETIQMSSRISTYNARRNTINYNLYTTNDNGESCEISTSTITHHVNAYIRLYSSEIPEGENKSSRSFNDTDYYQINKSGHDTYFPKIRHRLKKDVKYILAVGQSGKNKSINPFNITFNIGEDV